MSLLAHLSALPKIARRLRGGIIRALIRLAGGRCGPGLRVEAGLRLRHGFHNGLRLGNAVYIGRMTTIDCPLGAELDVGSRVTFTQGVFIGVSEKVKIGDDVLIGEYASIREASHAYDDLTTPIRLQGMKGKPIVIGDDCWIGRGACILPGTRMENGVVVGANAVVRGMIASDSVISLVPAQVFRQRGQARAHA
jgi:acetyltransferase-like isoleucine patch superfamily enzyme